MAVFKDHKVSVSELLQFVPEELLGGLSSATRVDHYTKVLHGQKLFYLLLYGLIENEKMSQRTLEETFNDSVFKILFKLDENEKVRRSSISERLSKINPEYFKEIYDVVYEKFSRKYSAKEQEKYNLIRVDSSMVSETVGKLSEGIDNKSGKKAVKYTVAFDGLLPCSVEVFMAQKYGNEDNALPEVVKSHVKTQKDRPNLYILDRGLQSTRTMTDFIEETVKFVCRAKENRKYIEIDSFIHPGDNPDLGELILLKDSKVQLYGGVLIHNKRGNTHYKEKLVETEFRLVIAKSKTDDKQYYFLTNEFNLSAKEIALAYRRRWDIEVFFRFIKQELNASNLVSLNKNGIEVLLYMSLIAAMLLLVYKKENNIGYKTAKRRFAMEVRDLAIAIIVRQCGGDPDLFFKT